MFVLFHYIGIFFQDFSHDGEAPDVYFWADGVIIPYITRLPINKRNVVKCYFIKIC